MTVSVLWLYLMVLRAGLQCVIVVLPCHTDLLLWVDGEGLFATLRRLLSDIVTYVHIHLLQTIEFQAQLYLPIMVQINK